MRFPSLLDFENKRNYFRNEIHKLRGRDGMGSLRVIVNRNSIFQDSYNQLAGLPVEDLKGRKSVIYTNTFVIYVQINFLKHNCDTNFQCKTFIVNY